MKKDLPLLIQSIVLSALSGIHQQAAASTIPVVSETTPGEAALRLKVLKASLTKPSFILKAINGGTGAYEGNFHRSHRSHSSHRSHYSSYSGSSGSSSGSSSSGSSGSYRSPSYSPGSTSSSPSSGHSSTNPQSTSPLIKTTPATLTTPTNYRLGERMLNLGVTGSDVLTLKNLLILKGYYVKPNGKYITNEYDDDTRNAVKKLQQANKLPNDGIVDPVVVAYLSNGITVVPRPSLLGNRLLQWGLTGPDVVELKTKLIQKGYLDQILNERFDDATEKAVKVLQRDNGLSATGQVTDEVIKLLL